MVKRRFSFNRRGFGEYGLERLKKEYFDVDVDSVINSLIELVDSGLFMGLFVVYTELGESIHDSNNLCLEMTNKPSLLMMADKYLDRDPLRVQLNLISNYEFYYFYPLLEWTYSMYMGRILQPTDVERLFRSGIAEKIVFGLKNFDKIDKAPIITPTIFEELRTLEWQDNKTKKFSREIIYILTRFTFKKSGFKEKSFDGRIFHVVLFLAGCNAVKNERNRITTEDVITAHRTFYKIIMTDISKLIDSNNFEQKEKGYLVCSECGAYYQIPAGESPDDYSDTCECGGHLEYREEIDNLK